MFDAVCLATISKMWQLFNSWKVWWREMKNDKNCWDLNQGHLYLGTILMDLGHEELYFILVTYRKPHWSIKIDHRHVQVWVWEVESDWNFSLESCTYYLLQNIWRRRDTRWFCVLTQLRRLRGEEICKHETCENRSSSPFILKVEPVDIVGPADSYTALLSA